jgi:hypothetical protein
MMDELKYHPETGVYKFIMNKEITLYDESSQIKISNNIILVNFLASLSILRIGIPVISEKFDANILISNFYVN